MKPVAGWALLWALASMVPAYAQVYKWVGPDGKVHYGDTPPPVSATKGGSKAVDAPPPSNGVALPYDVAEAVRKNPVVLYSSTKCTPCDSGRSLLSTRGIPFTEKTVHTTDDAAHLKQISGDSQLPALMVGTRKHLGFSKSEWDESLTAAGYPATSKLPKSYRNPPPQAAAPAPKAEPVVTAKPSSAESALPLDVPTPAGNAPPGFRF